MAPKLAVSSKFKHVFATPAKNDAVFKDIKPANTIWDLSNFLAANSTVVAVSWSAGGGGRVAILPLAKPGRQSDVKGLVGHTGGILDFAFSPFQETIMATCGEDTTIKVWNVPEGGLTEDLKEPLTSMSGHGKKVGICRFSHAASNVFATAAMDHLVKFWDIEKGEKLSVDVHSDQIMSMDFNLDSSQIVTTSRDKKVRLIDVRANKVGAEGTGHGGNKAQKAVWAKRKDRIITTGFGRSQDREVFVFDPRNMSEKLFSTELDQASSVMLPFYDDDTNMLYLGGKGDGNIRYFELWDNNPMVVHLSDHNTSTPQRGLCMLPKKAVDTSKCEVARMFKLEGNQITPISFQCPRKAAATEFQEDVYPETFSTVNPALSATEYFGGETKEPNTMSMRPGEQGAVQAKAYKASASAGISMADVEAQRRKVAEAREVLAKEEAKLAELEKALKGDDEEPAKAEE